MFGFGLTVAIVALIVAYLFIEETLPWAHSEAAARSAGTASGPPPRLPEGFPDQPTTGQVFALVSYRHRDGVVGRVGAGGGRGNAPAAGASQMRTFRFLWNPG